MLSCDYVSYFSVTVGSLKRGVRKIWREAFNWKLKGSCSIGGDLEKRLCQNRKRSRLLIVIIVAIVGSDITIGMHWKRGDSEKTKMSW